MWILLFNLLFSQTVSSVVGQASNHVVTSREVEASVVFSTLYPNIDKPNYFLPLSGKGLQSATSNYLMEILIVKESESFRLADVKDAEVEKAIQIFRNHLPRSKFQSIWKTLEISKAELFNIAYRKLRANRFLEMKRNTFLTHPTESELETFYENRKNYYGSNYIEAKSKVQADLEQEKLDTALKEWFQVLRTKYEIRNLLIEG